MAFLVRAIKFGDVLQPRRKGSGNCMELVAKSNGNLVSLDYKIQCSCWSLTWQRQ